MSVFVSFQIHSQSYFNRLDTIKFLNSAVTIHNDTVYAVGDMWNNQVRAVSITKHDMDGVLLIRDTLSSSSEFTSTASLHSSASNLYIASTYSSSPPFENSTWDIYLTKHDYSLDGLSWSTELGGNTTEQPNAILEVDNSIYISATTNSFGAGLGDFYLIKTDTNGNVIWDNTYGSSKNEIAWSITSTQDGNLLLSGNKKIISPDWDIYLVMVDTAGNLLWEKSYGTNWNDYYGGSSSTYDHSFLIYRNEDRTSQNTRSGFLEKLDGKGNLIWSKEFVQNDYSVFPFSVPLENEDGTIMVLNHAKNNSGNLIIKLHKLDPFGNVLWTKEFYTNPNKNQYIYDIKPTADSGYVMAGSARDSNLVQSGWLIKTNCNGEEDIQHPLTPSPCYEYDCTQYPIDANFTTSDFIVDLADGGEVTFENSSSNTTSRVWNFGDGSKEYTDGLITHTFTQEGIYEVQLIVFHTTCSDTFSLQIEVTNTANITTHNALEKEISLYPNPNKGSFILANNTNQSMAYNIYNAMGKLVFQGNVSSLAKTNLDLNLLPGVYIIDIQQNSSILTRKMVVR